MLRFLMLLVLPAFLAGCAQSVWAPDDIVARSHVAGVPPYSVTLVTVLSTRSNSGAHTGLVINGSERVLFDPAGTFNHPHMPERNDVIFGVTDQRLEIYYDYHARITYWVVAQTKEVPLEVANLLIQRVEANGPVAKAHCAAATSAILRGIPGFESIPTTWSPVKLMRAFGQLGGVNERKIYDDDADDNRYVTYIHPDDPVQP